MINIIEGEIMMDNKYTQKIQDVPKFIEDLRESKELKGIYGIGYYEGEVMEVYKNVMRRKSRIIWL